MQPSTTVISLTRLRCQALPPPPPPPPPPHHLFLPSASVNLNSMDTNNLRPNHSTEPNMDTNDWRGQLQPESRQRVVNKIMDTLKRHLPVSGQEGLHELWKIAQRFEEKIFTVATSRTDYLRKISLKMLTMETKSQGTMANNIPSNQVGPSNKPPDSGLVIHPQVHNPGQQHTIPLPNQLPNNVQQSTQSLLQQPPRVMRQQQQQTSIIQLFINNKLIGPLNN